MKNFLVFSLVFVSAMLIAADLTTKSGKVYENYRIVGVTSDQVSVSFRGGIAKIPMDDLPDDLREKYSAKDIQAKYAAEEKRKREFVRQQSVARRQKAALKKITLVLPGQIECIQILPEQNAFLAKHGAYENTIFCIAFVDTSKIIDGSILAGNRIVMQLWRNPVSQEVSREKVRAHVLYYIGPYQYTTVSGSTKTIACFTLSKKRALTYLEKNPNAGLAGLYRRTAYHYILPEYEVGW